MCPCSSVVHTLRVRSRYLVTLQAPSARRRTGHRGKGSSPLQTGEQYQNSRVATSPAQNTHIHTDPRLDSVVLFNPPSPFPRPLHSPSPRPPRGGRWRGGVQFIGDVTPPARRLAKRPSTAWPHQKPIAGCTWLVICWPDLPIHTY